MATPLRLTRTQVIALMTLGKLHSLHKVKCRHCCQYRNRSYFQITASDSTYSEFRAQDLPNKHDNAVGTAMLLSVSISITEYRIGVGSYWRQFELGEVDVIAWDRLWSGALTGVKGSAGATVRYIRRLWAILSHSIVEFKVVSFILALRASAQCGRWHPSAK